MLITRTPFRISLFGGGSDYPSYYNEYGGEVLGFAIDKYCWISLRRLPPFFEHKHRIVHSKIELVQSTRDIEHPVVREALRGSDGERCWEMHHDGDLPARSGLGSSSSFTVGLLNAVAAHEGQRLSALKLAREATWIERGMLCENVGDQDQLWAALGGFRHITFHQKGVDQVEEVSISEERKTELNATLMLFFTGFSRSASEVAGAQLANADQNRNALHVIKSFVQSAKDILESSTRPLSLIGEMLHDTWMLKRGLADTVSTTAIDVIYSEGLSAGAIGGKLLGAGGGGFMLFYVPREYQAAVRERLRGLIEVPFKIGAEGSKVVVNELEDA